MPDSYTVEHGDTYQSIAQKVYGDSSRWPDIARANPDSYRGGGVPKPKDLLVVPRQDSLTPDILSGKRPEDLTIMVGGRELPWMSARVVTTMDTPSDGWRATVPWMPGEDPLLDSALKPFAYPKASVYIGGDLVVNGYLSLVAPKYEASGRVKDVAGWSFTADALDSSVSPPYQREHVTPRKRVEQFANRLGVAVVVDPDAKESADKVYPAHIHADPSDKISEHLTRVLGPRGLLLSSTPRGDFHLTKAKNDAPIGVIREGEDVLVEASFEGRSRFRRYIGMTHGETKKARVDIATDTAVPRSRFTVFRVQDVEAVGLQKAVDWKRSKQIIDALQINATSKDWFGPNDQIWRPNTQVTLISDSIGAPDGFTFLIRQVEFSIDISGGRTAKLDLIPRQAYSGEPIKEPWL